MCSIDLRKADLAIFPPESTNRLWVAVCDHFLGSLNKQSSNLPIRLSTATQKKPTLHNVGGMKIAKNKRWAVCTVTLASSTPFSGSYRIIPAREIVTEQSDMCTIQSSFTWLNRCHFSLGLKQTLLTSRKPTICNLKPVNIPASLAYSFWLL